MLNFLNQGDTFLYPPNQMSKKCNYLLSLDWTRPWHDVQTIACGCNITRANQEKWSLGRWWKARPKIRLVGWYRPQKLLNNSSRIHLKWFKRIHFKLILLTSLFKSLFFKTIINCCYVVLIDVFSIITQWGFYDYVSSKKIMSDVFNKSVFANKKLIVII